MDKYIIYVFYFLISIYIYVYIMYTTIFIFSVGPWTALFTNHPLFRQHILQYCMCLLTLAPTEAKKNKFSKLVWKSLFMFFGFVWFVYLRKIRMCLYVLFVCANTSFVTCIPFAHFFPLRHQHSIYCRYINHFKGTLQVLLRSEISAATRRLSWFLLLYLFVALFHTTMGSKADGARIRFLILFCAR